MSSSKQLAALAFHVAPVPEPLPPPRDFIVSIEDGGNLARDVGMEPGLEVQEHSDAPAEVADGIGMEFNWGKGLKQWGKGMLGRLGLGIQQISSGKDKQVGEMEAVEMGVGGEEMAVATEMEEATAEKAVGSGKDYQVPPPLPSPFPPVGARNRLLQELLNFNEQNANSAQTENFYHDIEMGLIADNAMKERTGQQDGFELATVHETGTGEVAEAAVGVGTTDPELIDPGDVTVDQREVDRIAAYANKVFRAGLCFIM